MINYQTLSFTYSSQFFFQGNLSIEGSNINLTSIQLTTDLYITILNSNILFNSSTIISKECINLSNTTLTVDLSNTTDEGKILLLNSTSGCLNLNSFSLSYLHQPKCTILKSEEDTYSLYIIFTKLQDCSPKESENQLPLWIIIVIIVGSVVGLALIFIIIVLIVPKFRKAIFPYQRESVIIKS